MAEVGREGGQTVKEARSGGGQEGAERRHRPDAKVREYLVPSVEMMILLNNHLVADLNIVASNCIHHPLVPNYLKLKNAQFRNQINGLTELQSSNSMK